MYLIAGLGNPTRKYKNTRHNAGFAAIDELAGKYRIDVCVKDGNALTGKGVISGENVMLVKPQTYMNLSGESILYLSRYYRVSLCNIIIIVDDINLPLRQIRIRKKGSAGGHNGLKNIIYMLGSDEFMRVRIGVGQKPAGMDLADYVTNDVTGKEKTELLEGAITAAMAVVDVIEHGIEHAMNIYNKKNDIDL